MQRCCEIAVSKPQAEITTEQMAQNFQQTREQIKEGDERGLRAHLISDKRHTKLDAEYNSIHPISHRGEDRTSTSLCGKATGPSQNHICRNELLICIFSLASSAGQWRPTSNGNREGSEPLRWRLSLAGATEDASTSPTHPGSHALNSSALAYNPEPSLRSPSQGYALRNPPL